MTKADRHTDIRNDLILRGILFKYRLTNELQRWEMWQGCQCAEYKALAWDKVQGQVTERQMDGKNTTGRKDENKIYEEVV